MDVDNTTERMIGWWQKRQCVHDEQASSFLLPSLVQMPWLVWEHSDV
jgi:hypothetical protein